MRDLVDALAARCGTNAEEWPLIERARRRLDGVPAAPAPTEWMDEARALLSEVYGFASTSPRAQDNINAVLELFDKHAAGVPVLDHDSKS
jgi:hypothetical protein